MKFIIFNIIFILAICIEAVNPLWAQNNESNRAKSIVVFPFNFKNSQESEHKLKSMHMHIEKLLHTEKKYRMILSDKADLLADIHQSKLFKNDSKEDTAHIGSFLYIDYIVMGDVIQDKNLVINIVDIKRKEGIFTKVYDLKKDVVKLPQIISNDVDAKLNGYSFNPYNIYAHYSYFMPMNDLADIVTSGNGAGFGFAYELPFVSNLLIGGDISYYYLEGKTNVTHHATVMPMMANIQYRIDLGNLYIIPSLSAGRSYNALYYYTDTNISNDYIKRDSYDTTYKAGCSLGYSFRRSLSLFAGLEYGIFDIEGRDNRFVVFDFGVWFVF